MIIIAVVTMEIRMIIIREIMTEAVATDLLISFI
jgi:hypothetical protein